MQINKPSDGRWGFVAFYSGKQADVWADTLFQAKQLAVAFFKPPKSKTHMVSVVLAEKNGKQVTHVADF